MKRVILLFSAKLLLATTSLNAQIISTIAGNSTYDYGDGNEALYAKLNSPWALGVDDAGNVYFSEPDKSVIRKVDTHGIISLVAGNGTTGYSGDGGDATNAQLHIPYGVAVDHSGNVYIADSKNDVIRKVDAAGKISTAVTGLYNPFDVALDGAGNLYISDAFNYAIRKVSPAGIVTTVASGFSSTLTGGPYGYTGELWFPSNARLSGIAADAAGNVYIADYWDNIIRKVTPAGTMSVIAGHTGESGNSGDGGLATHALLNGPRRVTVDNAGNVVFADQGNCAIRKIGADGMITKVAGAACGYSGDNGPAINASLCGPTGIAFDQWGNLFIADQCNNRVRKVTPGGVDIAYAEKIDGIRLQPNPNNGNFVIRGNTAAATGKASVTVMDIIGNVVLNADCRIIDGVIDMPVSLDSRLNNGAYVLSVKTAQATDIIRFTLQH